MGIEPTYIAWKAIVLPLNYSRNSLMWLDAVRPEVHSGREELNRSYAALHRGSAPLTLPALGGSLSPLKRGENFPRTPLFNSKFKSWREELNPRPAVYKTAALPTELRQHRLINSKTLLRPSIYKTAVGLRRSILLCG